jgi:hypothetical protein
LANLRSGGDRHLCPKKAHKKRRRLLLQVSAKTTASDCGSCSNFVHPSVSYVMHIAFASHTLPGGRYRARYQTRYWNVIKKNIFQAVTIPLPGRYSAVTQDNYAHSISLF